MKNTMKTIGSIVFATLLIFSMAACNDGSGDKKGSNSGTDGGGVKESGTVTASESGTVQFYYQDIDGDGECPESCAITTDLKSPNDSFTLKEGSENMKVISDLEASQKVSFTVSVPKGSLNVHVLGSGVDIQWSAGH